MNGLSRTSPRSSLEIVYNMGIDFAKDECEKWTPPLAVARSPPQKTKEKSQIKWLWAPLVLYSLRKDVLRGTLYKNRLLFPTFDRIFILSGSDLSLLTAKVAHLDRIVVTYYHFFLNLRGTSLTFLSSRSISQVNSLSSIKGGDI